MSTTPPMSPPLPMVELVQKPAEKRSHERMNEPALDPGVQTTEGPEVLEIIPQPSRSTSPSKQGRILPRMKSIGPESPPTGHSRNTPQQQQQQQQRRQGSVQEEAPFPQCSDDSMHVDNHPKCPIEPFDWDSFEERFCKSMTELEAREDKLYEELTELTKFFEVWFSSLDLHEGDRACKRLKTRIHWVQGSERTLEEKRGHYMRVVEAFKRALALLGES